LTGTVTVPEARIRPRSIPEGSVSSSSDVVLASKAKEPSRYTTSIDLRLALGKAVTVSAFGLEGSIEGDLAVLQAPGKEILGNGELKIVDGTYRISTGGKWSAAIGKPLKIAQGFLSYAKSPINNPFLVLTAQREGGDITAGLRVFGTIKNPKMTFFSATDPGMSQSEVTTYLLTGIPPKRGADDPADRAVSVGTYVAPKLFAEYDHSLGDEADKIKLRYDLNDWIELQTETGDSQGGDIFFKIEK
jgi:translocation and assembly module TamB